MNQRGNHRNQRNDDGHRNTNPYGSASGDGNGGNQMGGGYGDDNRARQYGGGQQSQFADSADDYGPRQQGSGYDQSRIGSSGYGGYGARGNDRGYGADNSAPVSRGDYADGSYNDRTGQRGHLNSAEGAYGRYGAINSYGGQDHERSQGYRSDNSRGDFQAYGQQGYPGNQGNQGNRGQHFDPEYHQWREQQLSELDNDYQAWRNERYEKFSNEFGEWRKNRVATAGKSTSADADVKPGTTGQGGSTKS